MSGAIPPPLYFVKHKDNSTLYIVYVYMYVCTYVCMYAFIY